MRRQTELRSHKARRTAIKMICEDLRPSSRGTRGGRCICVYGLLAFPRRLWSIHHRPDRFVYVFGLNRAVVRMELFLGSAIL